MARFGSPVTLQPVTMLGRLRRWSRRQGKAITQKQKGFRSLRIDPLEDRCLLSVSPLDTSAILVNQTFGRQEVTNTAHSVAMSDDGDFVVAWTQYDPVLNAGGNPVLDSSGYPETVGDVYARYFTTRCSSFSLPGPGSMNTAGTSLPQGIATNFDNDPNTLGHFSLEYNTQTQMELAVTAGVVPAGDATPPTNANVAGQFTLWFDANGNGIVDSNETFVVNYNETTPQTNAQEIQSWSIRSARPTTARALRSATARTPRSTPSIRSTM